MLYRAQSCAECMVNTVCWPDMTYTLGSTPACNSTSSSHFPAVDFGQKALQAMHFFEGLSHMVNVLLMQLPSFAVTSSRTYLLQHLSLDSLLGDSPITLGNANPVGVSLHSAKGSAKTAHAYHNRCTPPPATVTHVDLVLIMHVEHLRTA